MVEPSWKPSEYNSTKVYTVFISKNRFFLQRRNYVKLRVSSKLIDIANESNDKSDSTINNSGSDSLQRNVQHNSAFHVCTTETASIQSTS